MSQQLHLCVLLETCIQGSLTIFDKKLGRAAFVSHQWVGGSHPDPEFKQMQVLKDTLRCSSNRQRIPRKKNKNGDGRFRMVSVILTKAVALTLT